MAEIVDELECHQRSLRMNSLETEHSHIVERITAGLGKGDHCTIERIEADIKLKAYLEKQGKLISHREVGKEIPVVILT